ncbi:HNH endonuclease family protein [Pseudonocardia nigra]|uniref:HNH endonuclease family protein n=1 Tax=Pseudonocardia nigra TaxID=1921578 RepID=UPI0027E2AE82|nr:HNH endonuclease family protein [Pseudonocardia nigra]
MRKGRGLTAVAGAVLAAGLAAGCADLRTEPVPESTGDAVEALAALPVKGRAPRTGYDRDEFGQRWADVDRNGCDQRNDVLARDLVDETFRPGTQSCVVLTGRLTDPYSGSGIAFTRGQDTSDEVQIDHVVALSNAWQTGAQQLDPDTRELLGNDPLNLLAVDGPTNQAKGDGDAATWLPPQRGYRCAYVARQVAVKAKYGLWVTAAEREAIARILDRCPGEPLPSDPAVPAPSGGL